MRGGDGLDKMVVVGAVRSGQILDVLRAEPAELITWRKSRGQDDMERSTCLAGMLQGTASRRAGKTPTPSVLVIGS